MGSLKDDQQPLDLARDVPTTAEDVAALQRIGRDVPSWFSLTPEEIDALIPESALENRPPTSTNARPFTLV